VVAYLAPSSSLPPSFYREGRGNEGGKRRERLFSPSFLREERRKEGGKRRERVMTYSALSSFPSLLFPLSSERRERGKEESFR